MYEIVKKRKLNQDMTLMELQAPRVSKNAKPGQFILLIVDEYGERIPLTMAGYDREKGTVTIIYAVVGKTTMLLDQMKEGEALYSVVGPLGKPTHLKGLKRVAIVGGGSGNALAFGIATGMQKSGICVDMICGYKTRELVILENEFQEGVSNLYITTDDGSYGYGGFTTDKLKELIDAGNEYDEIIAVGPPVMMKFVSQIAKERNIRAIASLTAYMIDGTGMCGGCRVTVGGEDKFVCVDGPEFEGDKVDWDELINRNKFYQVQEEEDAAHVCRLEGGVRYYD